MTPQEFFKKDLFAGKTGVELIEIKEGYSKARLVITEEHLNAGHRTQGGALFTQPPTLTAYCPFHCLPISLSCAAAV